MDELGQVYCQKCGAPAAFPKGVTEPFTCSTCQAGTPAHPVRIKAWRLERDTMGGSTMEDVVYINELVAKLRLERKPTEEFVNWKLHEVSVRLFNRDEGAVGRELVRVDWQDDKDALRQQALAKLTKAEKEALGL